MSLLARLSLIQDPLDLLDTGVDADTVIDTLRRRLLPLKGLNLGHNALGDAGLARLLAYLRTAPGVRTLGLTTTGLGDAALAALAHHFAIANGCKLEELSLQNNKFTGDASTLAYFAHGLNTSRLRTLALSSNALGDAGLGALFGALAAPCLRELHVSATGLTDAGAPALCAFLRSPRSAPLRALHMNGNSLGPVGVGALVKAVDEGNFWLEKVELFANDIAPDDKLLARLGTLLARNRLMRLETRRSALRLLSIARVALLHPRSSPASAPSSPCTALVLRSAHAPPPVRIAWWHWLALPYELRLAVLRFAVHESALSQAQHTRVCAYAEAPVSRHSDVEEWLEQVGCSAYEPDDE